MVQKLNALNPTPEEVAQARAAIAKLDQKGKRARMGSMKYWLDINKAGNEEVSESRGDKRKEFLELYQVHMMRQKSGKTELHSSSTVASSSSGQTDVLWWSVFQMDKEMGEVKAKAWRDSGKLIVRADPLTGSMDEALKEYGVSRDWSTIAWRSERVVAVKTEGEADEKDLQDLTASAHGFAGTDEPHKPALMKKEPGENGGQQASQNPEEDKFKDIEGDPKKFYTKFNEMRLLLGELLMKTEGKRFLANLEAEVNKLMPKIRALCTIFENMLTCRVGDKGKATGKLGEKTIQAEIDFDEIELYAKGAGLLKGSKKRKQ